MPADAVAQTIGEALQQATHRFRTAGLESPGLDARRLIAGCCGLTVSDVLLHPDRPMTPEEADRLASFAARRIVHEPVSRILGTRAFRGLDFEITPATLDPRPETETLVDGALDLVRSGRVCGGRAPRILDLGTGSGAILLTLLSALPDATGLGVDCSKSAITTAARNARNLGLDERCRFYVSDWFSAVSGTFDLIVSNPPYIPHDQIANLDPDVRLYDPITALDGGGDGVDPYRTLFAEAPRHLAAGGWLVVEMGHDQEAALRDIWSHCHGQAGHHIEIWKDMAGKPRCVAIRPQTPT